MLLLTRYIHTFFNTLDNGGDITAARQTNEQQPSAGQISRGSHCTEASLAARQALQ